MKRKVSIIIPVLNEEESIPILLEDTFKVLNEKIDFEVIVVNDGSTDNTLNILKSAKKKYLKKLKIVNLRKRSGQSSAMMAGVDHASNELIAFLDGDGQNPPSEILKLYKKMNDTDSDIVCGWREKRKDSLFKKVFSKFSNFLAGTLLGLRLHDYGSTLKLIKKEAFENVSLYGEQHRYYVALMYSQGFKVIEVETKHKEREMGQTKYGFGRLVRGFLDLFGLWLYSKVLAKTVHYFMLFGFTSSILGVLLGIYLVYLKLILSQSIGTRPLLTLSVLLFLAGIMFFLVGMIFEIYNRVIYKTQKPYNVKEVL